jgi:tRNA (guanine37-N1)-methyltransferase
MGKAHRDRGAEGEAIGEEYKETGADRTVEAGQADRAALVIDVITIFPEMFVGPFDHSLIRRARDAGLVDIRVHDLRQWATDRHRTTDDYAYGGGGGMVMKPEPLFAAVEDLLGIPPLSAVDPDAGAADPPVPAAGLDDPAADPTAVPPAPHSPPCPIVLLTPQGRRFDHALAQELAAGDRLVILAGHYEGFDERVRQHLATHEVSVGDFVLTGGEIPAMLIVDAVARLRPGVVGLETATATDSFADGLLEHPHYTRPAEFRGWSVPEILLSGHHAEVERWRRRESLRRTWERRPELLADRVLTGEEKGWVEEWGSEGG